MNNSNVAHLWAHKERAKASGSSFYFDGDTIYSYGRHFPIARHVTGNGGKAILFTTGGSSQSTSAHKNLALHAIPPGVPIFYVSDPTRKPCNADLVRYTERAVECVTESNQPRKTEAVKARLIGQAEQHLNDAQSFAEFFGLEYDRPADVVTLASEWQAEIEAENKRKVDKAKRDAKRAEKEAAGKIAAFIAGEDVRVPNGVPYSYARIEGKELATSKGARVPLRAVKLAMPEILRLIEAGKAWKTNGDKISVRPYEITEITETGAVVAGCHLFAKTEVLRVASLIKNLS